MNDSDSTVFPIRIPNSVVATFNGLVPAEFHRPVTPEVFMGQDGIVTNMIGQMALGPRLILSPPKPEPVEPLTLPDGWELAEPERRLPMRGEYFFVDAKHGPQEARFDFREDKEWIVRRKPSEAALAAHPANDPENFKDTWTGPAAQRAGFTIKTDLLRENVLCAAAKAAELAGALDTLAESMDKAVAK
jgi:hypothetical protein